MNKIIVFIVFFALITLSNSQSFVKLNKNFPEIDTNIWQNNYIKDIIFLENDVIFIIQGTKAIGEASIDGTFFSFGYNTQNNFSTNLKLSTVNQSFTISDDKIVFYNLQQKEVGPLLLINPYPNVITYDLKTNLIAESSAIISRDSALFQTYGFLTFNQENFEYWNFFSYPYPNEKLEVLNFDSDLNLQSRKYSFNEMKDGFSRNVLTIGKLKSNFLLTLYKTKSSFPTFTRTQYMLINEEYELIKKYDIHSDINIFNVITHIEDDYALIGLIKNYSKSELDQGKNSMAFVKIDENGEYLEEIEIKAPKNGKYYMIKMKKFGNKYFLLTKLAITSEWNQICLLVLNNNLEVENSYYIESSTDKIPTNLLYHNNKFYITGADDYQPAIWTMDYILSVNENKETEPTNIKYFNLLGQEIIPETYKGLYLEVKYKDNQIIDVNKKIK